MRYVLGVLFIISAGLLPQPFFLLISFLMIVFSWSGGYTYVFFKFFGSDSLPEHEKACISKNFQSFSILLFISFSSFIGLEALGINNLFFIIFQSFAITLLNHESIYGIIYNRPLPLSFTEDGKPTTTNRFPLFYELVLIFLRFCVSFIIGLWLLRDTWIITDMNRLSLLLLISVIGSFSGTLFETIRSDLSQDTSVYLGTLLTILAFYLFEYTASFPQTIVVVLFSLFLAMLAFWAGIADFSALLSAAILGIIIILFSSLEWFVLLLTFFILGGSFTKYKFEYKKRKGFSEGKRGIRNYVNVFSNSLPALVLAVMYGVLQLSPEKMYLTVPITFAYIGSIANATGDTLASEIGTTSKGQTYMITNFKKTRPGQDGGISLLGEAASLFGSAVIGVLAYAFGMVGSLSIALLISFVGGFIGTNIDSLLGATLQKHRYISNSDVNLITTIISSVLCASLYFILF